MPTNPWPGKRVFRMIPRMSRFTSDTDALLAPDEPAPAFVERASSDSPFVIVCDHAGRRIPRALGTLGLGEADLERHIAWDIGAAGVAARLAEALGATLIQQRYSRLVIDCNRAPGHPTSIATVSESTPIPGNAGLDMAERRLRELAIFRPYHTMIAETLDARGDLPTCLISMHSFTPVFHGVRRVWEAGVLFDRSPAFGRALAECLRREGLVVGENEPYRMTQTSDYTVPVHAERRGLDYAEIEIRQDLIAQAAGQKAWADRLARLLPEVLRTLSGAAPAG